MSDVDSSLQAHAYRTSDGGRDWAEVASPGPQSFGDIGCTRAGACELMGGPVGNGAGPSGQGSVMARTTNGGTTWQRDIIPSSQAVATGICASAVNCIAFPMGGGGAEITNNAGGAWRFVAFGQAGEQVGSAACPSATVCYALGSDLMAGTSWMFRTVDAGKSWERAW